MHFQNLLKTRAGPSSSHFPPSPPPTPESHQPAPTYQTMMKEQKHQDSPCATNDEHPTASSLSSCAPGGRTPDATHADDVPGTIDDPIEVSPTRKRAPPTLERYKPRLILENSGSVARDHLASERTFLAYVRTSLTIASTGVGAYHRSIISSRKPQADSYSPAPLVQQH